MTDLCSCGEPVRKGKYSRYCPTAFRNVSRDEKGQQINILDPYGKKHRFNA